MLWYSPKGLQQHFNAIGTHFPQMSAWGPVWKRRCLGIK